MTIGSGLRRHSDHKKEHEVSEDDLLDESSSPSYNRRYHHSTTTTMPRASIGISTRIRNLLDRIPPQRQRPVLITLWALVSVLVFQTGFHLGQQHPNSSLWGTTDSSNGDNDDGVQHVVPSYNKPSPDGWTCIDVFYGNATQLDTTLPPPEYNGGQPQPNQEYYSQAFQDKVVARLFGSSKDKATASSNPLFFVDVGAYDARTFSNTFILQRDYHWKGLCIEPNPAYWHELAYRGEGCQVVGAVVGRHSLEEVSFRMENGILGGMVNDMFHNTISRDAVDYPHTPGNLKYTVPLVDILRRYNCPKIIQYMSLDVNGAEEYVWTLFPQTEYRIQVLTVQNPSNEMRSHLTLHGYQMLKQLSTWGEFLWAHRSIVGQLDLTVLDEIQV